ncbi:MAG: hypothetical protein AB7O97_03180 [Planctomycetota bacterium]
MSANGLCAARWSSLWLTALAVAQGPQSATPALDGQLCPPGRWYVAEGNASRNASSAGAPVLRRPGVRWRQSLGAPLLGEPLVWDDLIVVAVQPNDKRRALQARRLADGSLIAERSILSTEDMHPSLWGREVVSRVGADGLELLRVGARSVDSVARIPRASSVGPPLRFGTAVYVVIDGRLCALRAADFRVLWQSDEVGYVGRPSLLGDRVHALRMAGADCVVRAHDRAGGAVLQQSEPVGLERLPGDDAAVLLTPGAVFARFGGGPLLRDFGAPPGIEPNAIRLPIDYASTTAIQALAMPTLPAASERLRIVASGPPDERHLGLFRDGDDRGVQLDANAAHRTLVAAPPTLCGDVFYLGACAVAADDLRVLWWLRADGERSLPLSRAIPARGLLLLGHGDELVALGDDGPDDVVGAELRALQHAHERELLQQLVDDAAAAADWELAQELLARCRELSADEAWATRRDKDLERRARRARAKVDAGRVAKVRAAAAAAGGAAVEAVFAAVSAWGDERPSAVVRRGLRFVLEQQPAHPAAVAAVRAMLPVGLPAPAEFDAVEWLKFVTAVAQAPVTFLEASLDEFADREMDPILSQSKQQLLEWRDRWRPDLQALQSERLLLFTPVDAPGSLANALSTGELVCDALESLFADLPAVREDPRPMLVFLYSNKDEYQRESAKVGVERISWTAGYYSDHELVPKSRLFVPGDAAGLAGVLPTLAHELTHQWLMDRCRAFTPDKAGVMTAPRAFWIVEGFASLLEQFDFDLERRRFRLGNGDLQHVDLVASAAPGQLLDWDWLVRAGRRDYARLLVQRGEPQRIPSSVRMGLGFQADRITLFYAQTAMLCRYLFEAEGGRHRRALLDFVVAFYSGDRDRLVFEDAFGERASALAPRVVDYARALVR